MAPYHYWYTSTVCQFLWINPSLSDLLGMPGPPKFDESLGDRRRDTPLALNLVPRERTHEASGAGSSAGLVRLTPGPCASLPLDLAEDPLVANIVLSVYNGHVIMYTKTKVVSI